MKQLCQSEILQFM